MDIKKDAPSLEVVTEVVNECIHARVDSVERVLSGVSTYVYRLQLDGTIYYARVLPEKDKSFSAEVKAHGMLREKGVQV